MKFFKTADGYGFIAREGKPDIYVFRTGLVAGKTPSFQDHEGKTLLRLFKDLEVCFDVIQTPKGLRAVRVRVEGWGNQ